MSEKPKILMLAVQLGYGGAETSFIRLANFLAQSMDVTVALFTSDYGTGGAYSQGHEPLNAKIILLDDAPTYRLKRWWRRIQKLRELKAQHDATISFLSGPNMVNVLAGNNERTVISLRGSRAFDPVASPWSRRFFQYVLDPIAYRLAGHIVPVSAGLKKEIRDASDERTLAKVTVISPFVDIDAMQRRLAQPLPEAYAELKDQKVIVAVGRLSVEKGFQHLIRVFAEVSRTQRDAKLLLVGDGPMLTELRQQCIRHGIKIDDCTPNVASVIFAGYQKNVLPFIALGRVYAMTSATEGFPNVVLEAIAANVPVVAADTPWGARAILSRQKTISKDPYPTVHPTRADYGLLMPRIDKKEYQRDWAHTLGEYLETPHVPGSKIQQRLQDYTLETVGEKWKRLIERIRKS